MIRYYRHKIAAAAKQITTEPQFSSEDVLELLMSVEELLRFSSPKTVLTPEKSSLRLQVRTAKTACG